MAPEREKDDGSPDDFAKAMEGREWKPEPAPDGTAGALRVLGALILALGLALLAYAVWKMQQGTPWWELRMRGIFAGTTAILLGVVLLFAGGARR